MKARYFIITRHGVMLFVLGLMCTAARASTYTWWTDQRFLRDTGVQVDKFFGRSTGSYLWPHALIADQIGEALGGAPEPEVDIDSGRMLFFAASRSHSGREHAGIVTDSHDTLLYAALIHFNCIEQDFIDSPPLAARIASLNAERMRLWALGVPTSRLPPRRIATTCDPTPALTIFTHSPLTDAMTTRLTQWAVHASNQADIKVNVRVVP
jgi:hypothetical protein